VPEQRRHVEFEAAFNFRDMGGYPTAGGGALRWHTLYRSDTLHRLTDADAEVFAELGLRTVVDLRSVTELEDYGALRHRLDDVSWHHLPMLDNVRLAPREPTEEPRPEPEPVPPGHHYAHIAAQFSGSIAEVFHVLARPQGLPAVFHCTAGKDRTGIVAALVLDVSGVPDDVIAADYVLTERSHERSTAYIREHEPDFHALLAQIPPERRGVSGDNILGFLDVIRAEHGSAAGFLEHVGVAAAELDALRDELVED
jgi:protein-tyrosine phosphatase